MFNVGIIGAARTGPVVALSNALLANGGLGTWDIQLLTDGSLLRSISGSYVIENWYLPGVTPGIGSDYEVMREAVAGAAPLLESVGVFDTWQPINTRRFASWTSAVTGNRGRVRLSIRKAGTSLVLASAEYWNHSTFAP